MDEGGKVPDETVGQLGDWVDETAVTGLNFVAEVLLARTVSTGNPVNGKSWR
jgi:hypothetical protein